jgi:hypothetical protein
MNRTGLFIGLYSILNFFEKARSKTNSQKERFVTFERSEFIKYLNILKKTYSSIQLLFQRICGVLSYECSKNIEIANNTNVKKKVIETNVDSNKDDSDEENDVKCNDAEDNVFEDNDCNEEGVKKIETTDEKKEKKEKNEKRKKKEKKEKKENSVMTGKTKKKKMKKNWETKLNVSKREINENKEKNKRNVREKKKMELNKGDRALISKMKRINYNYELDYKGNAKLFNSGQCHTYKMYKAFINILSNKKGTGVVKFDKELFKKHISHLRYLVDMSQRHVQKYCNIYSMVIANRNTFNRIINK